MGITIVSGNTLDTYSNKNLVGHLLAGFDREVPVIGLSPDQGLTALRCPKEMWDQWYKEVKDHLNPMLGGSPWLAFSVLIRIKNPIVGIIDFGEAFLAADKWESSCAASIHTADVLRWADDEIPASVFIVARDNEAALHPALRNPRAPIGRIELSLPDESARRKVVKPDLAKKVGGLTMRQLTLVKSGKADWQKIQADAVSRATDGTLTAQWCDSNFNYIGGLAEAKAALLDDVLPAFKRRDRYSPMGIIFNGAPGTGKSVMAEAIAGHLGEPLYTWAGSMSTSMYVGENERRMKMALEIIQSTGGILYMDEGDKMFSSLDGPQGDSGVQARLQMMLHTYLADNKHRGHVLCIMSLNRIHALPSSLRRAGRFDIIIPFFPPVDAANRAQVIHALQAKHEIEMEEEVVEHIATNTAGWTGADLEALLMLTVRKDPSIELKTAQECIKHSRPTFTPEQIEKLVRDTAQEVRDIRLIPEELRTALGIGK